jgi:hypothetical protein
MKISFSLHQYNTAMAEFMQTVKRGSEQLDPILSQIERIPVSHGGRTRQVSEPKIVETEMNKATVEASIKTETYRKTDVDAFAGFLWDFCDQINVLEKQLLFSSVSKTTEAVGNVVDGREKNIYDGMIEMLEKKEMRFDAEGKHGDSFVLTPNMIKHMQENPPTLDQTERWNRTMEAKKAEYYAKKRTRRLS